MSKPFKLMMIYFLVINDIIIISPFKVNLLLKCTCSCIFLELSYKNEINRSSEVIETRHILPDYKLMLFVFYNILLRKFDDIELYRH